MAHALFVNGKNRHGLPGAIFECVGFDDQVDAVIDYRRSLFLSLGWSQMLQTNETLKTEKINGSCHCGAVKLRVRLTDGFRTAQRCTCFYCRMRGAVAVSAYLDDIEVVEGQDSLTLYQFGTMTAKHYFCGRCGIYTHHQRRSNPQQYGVNVACLEGVSPFDFTEVPVNDGVSHPADAAPQGPRIDGVLRYERNSV